MTSNTVKCLQTLPAGYFLLNEQRPGQGKDVHKSAKDAASNSQQSVETATKGASGPGTKADAAPSGFVPKVKPPLTDKEQRDIYQYVLDEKRKMKPKTKQEKAQIDGEKALLKEWIRSKSIPSL